VQNLIFQLTFVLLKDDGLLFLSLALLGILKVFLFAQGSAIADLLGQVDQTVLDFLIDLKSVMCLGIFVPAPLSLNEDFEIV